MYIEFPPASPREGIGRNIKHELILGALGRNAVGCVAVVCALVVEPVRRVSLALA